MKKNNKEKCNCDGHCKCHEQEKECTCKEHCDGNHDEIKVKEIEDKYLRLQAEYVNFRNRTSMDVSNMLKYEGESFIKELLPIVDNFERAIMLDDNDLSDEVSKYLSGFKMIYGNLIAILNAFEVNTINALGLEFNPNVMDAVLTEHDETKPENVVLEVLTKGYTYKDKVIRPCMVKVNK